MKQPQARSKRGGFNYVTAILLIVLLAIAFVGYTLVPVYYAESQWKRFIKNEILNAYKIDDTEMRMNLQNEAEKLGISLAAGDGLHVSRFRDVITVRYEYERETLMPGMNVISFQNEYREEVKVRQKLFDD